MARKLKKSVYDSMPYLKESEEKEKRKLKQSVYEDMPYLKENRGDDNIAPVAESKGGNKDSWFKGGAFSDGYQFGDATKAGLGTAGDIVLGAYKGAGRMVEGLLDLGTYGVAGVADLFGADEFAEKAKKEARRSRIDEFTSGATDFVDKYSVLGNKGDMISEGLGQVASLIVTGGLAGAAGLGGAGVTAVTTGATGLSSMGTNMGEAYDSGASDNEAFWYGLGTGAIEAGTELLFGGLGKSVKALGISRGIGGLDDIFAKKLSSQIAGSITNEAVQKALGNTVEYAVKASGEGFEEVLSGLGSAVMKKLTYEDDETLQKLIEDEKLLEQFIVGTITSSIVQGGDFVRANKSGTDFVTGQTTADEKVINKLVEDEVAKRKANGETVSAKDKNEIYDSVVEQMEKGQLDIDTIESVLGGDKYTAYKDHVDNTTKLKTELDELRNMKASEMTDIQTSRMNELKEMNLDDTTKRSELRNALDDTLAPMLKNSKLTESYREAARRRETFTADLSKYKGKQRESVERAIKSGVLNNTYRSHELVELLSKIEAEKGIVFDLVNNEKLKETGFALEGKTVNGFANKSKGTVTLNVQSAKAWQSVVGHEVTHILEGTDAYDTLRTALYEYATSKGELESRRASLTKLYNGMDADIETELTADLVGDYLFTDKNFIKHLTGNRNLFEKIYDEIKYLWNAATGKEKTEIEKVKAEFDKAWKELAVQGTNEDVSEADDSGEADVDYSISVTDKATLDSLNEQVARGEYDAETNPDGGYYVTYKSMSFWGYDEDGNAILRSPMAEYVDGELSNAYLIPKDKSKLNWYQATETIDEGTGLPSGLLVKTKQEGKKSFSYLPASENQHLINEDWSNLYFNLRKKVQKNGKWVNSDVPARYNPYEHSSNSMLNDQFSAAYLRDNLVTVKMYVPISEDNGAYRAQWSKDATGWSDWKTGTVAGKIGKQKDLQRRVYLSRYAAPVEIVPDSEVAQAYKGYLEGTDVAIPDNVVSPNLLKELKNAGVPIEESGKVQYSVSAEDSNGNQLSKEQQEYFKDSKVIDEKGNLKVMYHGTPSGDFTVFRDGTYFTENKWYADLYQNPGASSINSRKTVTNPKTYEVYLDIKKPFDISDPEARDIYINDYIKGGNATGINPYLPDAEYAKISSIDWTEGEDLRDFLIDNGYDYDGLVLDEGAVGGYGDDVKYRGKSYVTFSPEQVKNVDNKKPTSDPDIRYSLSKEGESYAPIGDYSTPFRELALDAPVVTDTNVGDTTTEAPTVDAPMQSESAAETPKTETQKAVVDKPSFISDKAFALYNEVKGMKKGVKVSNDLGYLLDNLDLTEENKSASYNSLRTALINIKNSPTKVVNENSTIESIAREMIDDSYDEVAYGGDELVAIKLQKVQDNIAKNKANRQEAYDRWEQQIAQKQAELDSRIAPTNLGAVRTQLANLESQRTESLESFNAKITQKQAELASKKNKDTKAANSLKMQIENLTRLRDSVDADYTKRIRRLENSGNNPTKLENNLKMQIERLKRLRDSSDAQYAKSIRALEERAKKMQTPEYSRAMRRRAKMAEHAGWAANLIGNTATWKDKKTGFQYAANTERRNLRDIVRDERGKADIARADRIDDALNGQYNRDEAERQRELTQKRNKFAEMKITSAEDAYIQMLGELRYNPDTELTQVIVDEYYEKHKKKIDAEKVDKIIEMARQDYDDWFTRVNAELRAQGMREIPYRLGYFPHTHKPEKPQNFIQKLLNWKTQDNDIPTSIAGLTETFKPTKSYQSFDKSRTGDKTEYSFKKGYDTYSEGVTDWIYHLDILQKRRAVENFIRLTHSDEGIHKRIQEVYADEAIDANEAQERITAILAEADNPLNNFVQDFTTHTNILAGKKNSLDRTMEQGFNRKIYSVMTNVQNRVTANMVLANVRSALTNFIPITQSWAQVSPLRSLQATKDTIANAIKDDGIINKSTFLTNRLKQADKLYQTTWDKVLDKAGIMFEIVDNFSSQVIWRSKYNQNLANGMSESAAIKNADQFAENVMAGRSKGNEPTLFTAKNPLIKAFTAFQLEVNNQYGYLFKDVPNDLKAETEHWKLNLVKGYATAFVGAYVYNALMERITGSEAALDPIGIIEELLRDLGLFDDDDEEEKEPKEAFENLKDNILEQVPFVGGYFGGGRFPISNALPIKELVTGKDSYGNEKSRLETIAEAAPYTLLPFGYGQIKKTAQGLNMFSDEHPVSGSYTDSGSLRFPVEDTLGNRIQAGLFGQYASGNAREYFDNGYAPLKEKQIQEYIDSDMPIKDYWEYREGLKEQETLEDKFDYIAGLDLPVEKKNILINNVVDRKEPVDLENYDDFGSLEEFDFATKNPEKYSFAKSVGGYSAYKTYSSELYDIKADKDASGKSINGSRKEKVIDYINNLDADYYTKIILYKSEYTSDDTYNQEIVDYIVNRADLTYEDRVAILTELGFRVAADGQIYAD